MNGASPDEAPVMAPERADMEWMNESAHGDKPFNPGVMKLADRRLPLFEAPGRIVGLDQDGCERQEATDARVHPRSRSAAGRKPVKNRH